jgi:Uma2 family endonuclease
MLRYNPLDCLPSSEELPDSDDTPVDNELQNLVPNLLGAILAMIWSDRTDWFFGVDMGVYFAPSEPPLVPDGFLSIGVDRFVDINGRLSYVFWEEDGIPPILALEVVSKTYGGEYERKKIDYAKLGILYYLIYAPGRRNRRGRKPLEIHRLEGEKYVLLPDEQVWMPEIGLGIGREEGVYQGWQREWLFWYDQAGNRIASPEELAQQAQQQAQQSRQRAERLAEKLRELGVDPSEI